jgi:hypothetical protein
MFLYLFLLNYAPIFKFGKALLIYLNCKQLIVA